MEKIEFLSLSGTVFGLEDNKYKFAILNNNNNNNNLTDSCESMLIVDPSYDQTFKRIFTEDNIIDNKSGNDRLIAFLNAILFPDAEKNEYKIRKINRLDSEITNRLLKFDVDCECTCWAEDHPEDEKVFDVKMQTGYQPGFITRLFDYGTILKNNKNYRPVIILGFMNPYLPETIEDDQSKWIGLFEKDLHTGNPIKPLSGIIDGHIIDLSYKSALLKDPQNEIMIGRKKIGKEGKEWIKLLSIRYWCNVIRDRYVLPHVSILNVNPELGSALKILGAVNEIDLKNFIDYERETRFQLSSAFEAGKKMSEIEMRKKDEEIRQKNMKLRKSEEYIRAEYKDFCKNNEMKFSKKLKKM